MPYYPPAQLRDYLIAEGLVREPGDAGTAPPAWVNHLGGAPYGPDFNADDPRHAQTTINIADDGGLATEPGLGVLERLFVRIEIRSTDPLAAQELSRQIANRLDGRPPGMSVIDLAGMRVEYSGFYVRPQMVSVDPDVVQGYLMTMTLLLAVHVSEINKV